MPWTMIDPSTGKKVLDLAHSGANAAPSGPAHPVTNGTTDASQITGTSTPTDYTMNKYPWYQGLPATDAALGDSATLAPALRSNTQAYNGNFQFNQNGVYNRFNPNAGGLNGALSQMYSGQQGLQNGPGNAFSRAQLQNMHAMSLGQLGSANRSAMQGLAGANAGRGVAGNSVGGILGQQLGVSQAGALAQGDLAEQQAGLNLGLNQYQARAGVASQLGNMVNSQDQRNFQAQDETFKQGTDEKQNAYSNYTAAQKAYNDLIQQYLIQSTTTSGAKNGDQTKFYIRAKIDDAKRNLQIAMQQYNQYGNANNPNYTTQMQTAA